MGLWAFPKAKGWTLSFLVDFKQGGDVYSNTNAQLTHYGQHKQTLMGRDGDFSVQGVNKWGDVMEYTYGFDEIDHYWGSITGCSEYFIYDASFIKLRQLVFGYTFPNSIIQKTPFSYINLSFVGRNLLTIQSHLENVDPESSYNNGNAQGLELDGMPYSRNYGFNLRVRF